jgi:predicted metalloprotease with PDZ domain
MKALIRPFLAVAALAWLALSARADEPITLELDATQAPRKILHAHLVIPVKPGPLVLLYPKWIPGEHSPTGPITDMVGLTITAGGKRLAWRRDDEDLYAIHCQVPEGAKAVEVSLDYLLPAAKEGFSSAASSTAKLALLSWNHVLLYPKGRSIQEQTCQPSVKLPAGWKLGSALTPEKQTNQGTTFAPVSLEMLVDSPVLCGAHFREIRIGPMDGPPHYLDLACDSEDGLQISPELKSKYDRLVAEAGALFGSRHYGSYRFLVSLSENIAHFGLEHHQCSDDRGPERMFTDDDARRVWATLLSHEFVHSWNGKYRRPADMVTTDFQQAQHTRLLWVYEGLTQYLGVVLAGRSGLWTPEECRDNLAMIAEWAENQRGRTWRPLDDTTAAAPFLYYASASGGAWRRGVDFYDEGVLIWLEVDMMIRRQTDGRKSLDDFCRRFHGGPDTTPVVKPYTLDDVAQALDAIAPYDWKAHLSKRVTAVESTPPLEGIRQGGWKLSYTDKQSDLQKSHETQEKTINLGTALGLILKDDGTVVDVIPGKPAERAGMGPAMKIVAVNSRRFSDLGLRSAIAATANGAGGIQLLIENGDFFTTYKLDYRGGEKYAHLERDPAEKIDRLADILKPLTPAAASTKKVGGESSGR